MTAVCLLLMKKLNASKLLSTGLNLADCITFTGNSCKTSNNT